MDLGVRPGGDDGAEAMGEADGIAGLQPLARAGEGGPAVRRQTGIEVDLDLHIGPLPTRRPMADQGGANDTGVVRHENVSRREEIRQVANRAVF